MNIFSYFMLIIEVIALSLLTYQVVVSLKKKKKIERERHWFITYEYVYLDKGREKEVSGKGFCTLSTQNREAVNLKDLTVTIIDAQFNKEIADNIKVIFTHVTETT